MSERPDCVVHDLSKTIVLEVRAAEMVMSDQYPTRRTLRFPRVVKVRYDKPWTEAMTKDELDQTIENFHSQRRLNN